MNFSELRDKVRFDMMSRNLELSAMAMQAQIELNMKEIECQINSARMMALRSLKCPEPITQQIPELIREKTRKIKALTQKDFTPDQIAQILEVVEKW